MSSGRRAVASARPSRRKPSDELNPVRAEANIYLLPGRLAPVAEQGNERSALANYLFSAGRVQALGADPNQIRAAAVSSHHLETNASHGGCEA